MILIGRPSVASPPLHRTGAGTRQPGSGERPRHLDWNRGQGAVSGTGRQLGILFTQKEQLFLRQQGCLET